MDVINGRYELKREIGAGSHGEVYEAYDRVLGREIALKRLRPHAAVDPEIRRRFTNEARFLAKTSHANVLKVYDISESGGQPFITMELVHGQTLADVFRNKGKLTLTQTRNFIAQIAAALDVVHDAGLVHRDVKPENIMVRDDGSIVLMDFGIAFEARPGRTTATEPFGTRQYASPEQIRGAVLTPASDVYSLAIVAYELLSGRPPFDGDPAFVLNCHLNVPPPRLSSVEPRVPEAVSDAIATALAKDPRQRPQTAGAFAKALARTHTRRSARPALPGPSAGPSVQAPPLIAAPTASQVAGTPATPIATRRTPRPSGPAPYTVLGFHGTNPTSLPFVLLWFAGSVGPLLAGLAESHFGTGFWLVLGHWMFVLGWSVLVTNVVVASISSWYSSSRYRNVCQLLTLSLGWIGVAAFMVIVVIVTVIVLIAVVILGAAASEQR